MSHVAITESSPQETPPVTEKKSEVEAPLILDPVLEDNENLEIFDKPFEKVHFVEIDPRIFSKKDVEDNFMEIEALDNAIYENGVVNLCWPTIEDPVFETRTCFPPSYYTNSSKERLLLAYAENFRRQFNFHYKNARKPLLLQAPNECGLQKMVCSTIRTTKLCFAGTNTWQGLASLVADYFEYEPLTKPMLHQLRAHLQWHLNPGTWDKYHTVWRTVHKAFEMELVFEITGTFFSETKRNRSWRSL